MNNVATLNTDTKPQTDEERREALRQRIEASEQRNAERSFADQAKDVLDSATDFAKKHPLAVARWPRWRVIPFSVTLWV